MEDIYIKKDSIVNKENAKGFVISWSKLRQFCECPVSWFCINYADIENVEWVPIDQTNAIGGTIVQKLFETFINQRVYLRENMKTFDDLLQWFYINNKALFKLIAKPIEDQFLSKYKNARYYFKKTKAGQKDVENAIVTYGLDKCIDPPQVTFINCEKLSKDYGTKSMNGEEGFLEHLNSLYGPILDLFVENKIQLNKMLSESFIKTKVNNIWLNGYIDFVYNKNLMGGVFHDLKQIGEEFIVLDGKIKISRYTHKEQLYYYGTLLYLRYKKRPSYVGFIDWTQPRFALYDFDQTYIDVLKEKIVRIQDEYLKIKGFMEKYPSKLIPLRDFELNYKASSNCVFCPLVQACKEGIARKAEIEKYILAIENKKETATILKDVDKTKPMQEIKL